MKYFIVLYLIQSCNEVEYPIKLGGIYFLFHNSWGHTTIIDTSRAYIIPSEIVAWNIDSVFIIAKQKPFQYIMDSLRLENISSAIIRDKYYKNSELYNYWIIDKRKESEYYYDYDLRGIVRISTDVIFGPLTYEEYWEKRKELNVSDTLKLKESEKGSFDSPIHYLFYKWFNSPRETVIE